jgi:hypothetical protein
MVGWRAALTLQETWQSLERRQPDGLPCHGWEALLAVRERARDQEDPGGSPRSPAGVPSIRPVVIVARVDGEPVALWPLQIETRRLARRIGHLGQGWLLRHAPLLSPEAPPGLDPVDLLFSTLPRVGPRALVSLSRTAVSTFGGRWLCEGVEWHRDWRRRPGPVEVRLDLRGGWSRVAASLTQRFRRRADASDRRLRRGPGEFRVLHLAEAGVDEARTLLEESSLRPTFHGSAAMLRDLAERAARSGRVSAWLAVDPNGLRAGSLLWHGGDHVVELWGAHQAGALGVDAMSLLRWDQLHALAADEACSALTLAPGGGADLVAVPEHQGEVRGAIGPPWFLKLARCLSR